MESTDKAVAEPARLLPRRRGHRELGHVELRSGGQGPGVMLGSIPELQRKKRPAPLVVLHWRRRLQH